MHDTWRVSRSPSSQVAQKLVVSFVTDLPLRRQKSMPSMLAVSPLVLLLLSGAPAARTPPGGELLSGDEDEVSLPAPALPTVLEGGRKRSRRLVLVLHGGSYRPRTPRELAERALAPLEEAGQELGLRLVAPIVPENLLLWNSPGSEASTVWASPAGEELLLAFLQQELRRKRVDPRRVYLAGHGAGATAAIHLAARHPGRFAAIALWSGTPAPVWARPKSGPPGPPGPQRGEMTHERKVVGLLGDPVPRLETVGVYLWTGESDSILDPEALALFVERMRDHAQRGSGHDFVWHSGPGGHDYGAAGPRAGLEFLKQHRLASRNASLKR
jgi:predicted esterase